MLGRRSEISIALTLIVVALVSLFIWIPLDSETPAIYEFRRNVNIGDAMLPMVAAAGMGICALIQLVIQLRRKSDSFEEPPFDSLSGVFMLSLSGIVAMSLILMYWAGPLAVAFFAQGGDDPVTYRQMRASLPWKYIGFVLGGFTMVFGIISLIEGKISGRAVLFGVLSVVGLIMLFDVPFDTILLPPNGDF